MKLKTTQLKPYREETLKKQNYCCQLCKLPITEKAVLDHDHKTGAIRSVLHDSCNRLEGIVVHWAKRTGIPVDLENYLLALIEYHKLHRTDQTGLTHPSHVTEQERKEKNAKKRRKKLDGEQQPKLRKG